MTTILVILLILSAGTAVGAWIYNWKTQRIYGSIKERRQYLDQMQDKVDDLKREESELHTNSLKIIGDYNTQISELKTAERVAQERVKSAAQLVEKEFEVEAAKRRDALERALAVEFSEISANSPKQVLQTELQEINNQIEEARRTLQIQQAKQLEETEKENFDEFHSITLSSADLKDIELIREFEPRLTRQEAFRKLVWTEFIQKPIQALCKILEAEKVRGIYKITNIKNGRMYIGQAVDIAARWKDHCKTALGIGSTSYMTNKFYKAMHDEGIENFTFEVLDAGDINLNEREVYWIGFYNATTFGYNTKQGG